jgi:hypothetical protein
MDMRVNSAGEEQFSACIDDPGIRMICRINDSPALNGLSFYQEILP